MVPPGSGRNGQGGSRFLESVRERSMPNKPRSFKEVVAARDPAERARLANRESFDDVTVANPFHREVSVIEDRDGTGEWRVEYFDDDGACYVTVFAGPKPRSGHGTISMRSRLDGYELSEPSEQASALHGV
jgi:hypothetical protein